MSSKGGNRDNSYEAQAVKILQTQGTQMMAGATELSAAAQTLATLELATQLGRIADAIHHHRYPPASAYRTSDL